MGYRPEDCHMRLRIPVEFQPFHSDPPADRHTQELLESSSRVNPEVHGWLASLGLVSPRTRVFHSTPQSNYLTHVDICDPWPNDFAFLNFAYGGEGSMMAWFRPRPDARSHDSSNSVSSRILSWQPDECDEICRAEIGRPSLINTGIPHTLIPGASRRICYSMALFLSTGERARWSVVASRFSQWIDDQPQMS